MVSCFKYLGEKINEGRNRFKEHKIDKIMKAKQYANLIMSVIAKSSNNVMIGKTYWKNVILAEILYGAEIIFYTKKEIEELQRAENQAFRQILGAPRYTPICTLRGEVGSSTMESRDKSSKIIFVKHLLQSDNKLLRDIAEMDYNSRTTKLLSTTHKYMEELGILKRDLLNKTNKQLKEIITNQDSNKWREEKSSKTTLAIYNLFKNNIKEENSIYDNSEESRLLFRARSNTLNLNWRNRFKINPNEMDTICPMCRETEETLEHFLLRCPMIESIRTKYNFWNAEEERMMLGKILCFEGGMEGN